MKIKLDENLPLRLIPILSGLGHDTDSVHHEGLKGKDDPTVWQAAQQEERFLITQDLDFSDLRHYIPGTHFGILLLRLNSPGRQELLDRVRFLFEEEGAENWQSCFVVATDIKIRIHRP